MNITVQAENTICIELTRNDMTELDITYEELDYSNIETRRVLWTLLDEARHELGHDIRLTSKMLIEAVPDGNGGCRIYFTVNDENNKNQCEKKHVRLTGTKTVCQSSDIDRVGELAGVLHKTGGISGSELYTDGRNYRLIISPGASFRGDINSLAGEFCEVCNPLSASFTREHWKLLASPDAIGIMSALS